MYIGSKEKNYPDLLLALKTLSFRERLQPRKHLSGGKTEIFTMNEKIDPPIYGLAYDFISLYPSIMVFDELPAGHPEIILHSFSDGSACFGLIYCRVLSLDILFVPTLPLRLKDVRTVCSLCRGCSEEVNIAKPCTHTNEQRSFERAWVSPLLLQAVADGYTVQETYKMHHFRQCVQPRHKIRRDFCGVHT